MNPIPCLIGEALLLMGKIFYGNHLSRCHYYCLPAGIPVKKNESILY